MKMMVDEQDDKPWHIGFPHMKKFSPWKTVSHSWKTDLTVSIYGYQSNRHQMVTIQYTM